jgi:hypothetical protein
MSLEEIEAEIERLPSNEVEQLARWLDARRSRRATATAVDDWLDRARGAANSGQTTEQIMALTRGDE